MPIYEYRCEDCDRVFERLQRISDEPRTACEGCGKVVPRIVSSPAIQFLGTGWYVTDYARKSGDKPGDRSGERSDEKAANGKNGSASKDAAPKDRAPKAGSGASTGKESSGSGPPAGGAKAASSSSSAGESRAG